MNASYRMVAWGANTFGQLALPPIDHPLPTACPLPPPDCQLPPTLITGGANHSLLVDAHGLRLYACGSNEFGQLGLPPTDPALVPVPLVPTSTATVPSALSWTRIPLPRPQVEGEPSTIGAVAAGWAHTLVVIEPQGYILACGDNSYGQLDGVAAKPDPATAGTWSRVLLPSSADDDPVTQVAAGLRHSVALTRSGRVFVWGAARHGQCGPSYSSDIGELVLPELGDQIPASIAAGSYHTLVATSSHVYGCGLNKHGQLGVLSVGKVHKVLDVVKCYDGSAGTAGGIARVHAGWSHSIIEMGSGSLVMFGRNTYHQLAHRGDDDFSFSPVSVTLPFPVHSVVPGSEHTIVLCTDNGDSGVGRVYSWGWNEHGNCGIQCSPQLDGWHLIPEPARSPVESLHLPNVPTPTPVHIDLGPHERIVKIGGGYAHGFVLIASSTQ